MVRRYHLKVSVEDYSPDIYRNFSCLLSQKCP